MIKVIFLAVVAGFLLFRLRDLLGRKTGHHDTSDWFKGDTPPPAQGDSENVVRFPGARDADPAQSHPDIAAITELDSDLGKTLIQAKTREPGFNVAQFLDGAEHAYEMILMAFEQGDKTALRGLLDPDVYESFAAVIDDRREKGYSVDARFVGLNQKTIEDARLDDANGRIEIDVRYDAEMITAVRNASGEVVEGDPHAVRRMSDLWTYARRLGASDPNWTLVATGD